MNELSEESLVILYIVIQSYIISIKSQKHNQNEV